jgi:hypothetical protein
MKKNISDVASGFSDALEKTQAVGGVERNSNPAPFANSAKSAHSAKVVRATGPES